MNSTDATQMTGHSPVKTLLQLNTSLFGGHGQSAQLADRFASLWREQNPDAEVIVRDLGRDPVPHVTAEAFLGFGAKPEERTPAQQAAVDYSDRLIEELRRADVILIGLPMYNFGVPSTLKAYFDQIARAGVTFSYSSKGPQGLLTGKKTYVFATSGGVYAGTAADTEVSYVRQFLSFIGMDDIELIRAEGLAMGDEKKQAALDRAARRTEELLSAELGLAA